MIVIGQSLGGAMLLNALTCKEARYVRMAVIEGTYAGLGQIGQETLERNFLTWPFQWIAPWVLDTRFDPRDQLARVRTPLLVITSYSIHYTKLYDYLKLIVFMFMRDPQVQEKKFYMMNSYNFV